MPEETDRVEYANIDLPPGLPSADTATWVEAKETFPGIVVTSRYRHCPPGYMEPNQFRKQRLPRPIVQWVLQIERLDQVWQNADGSQDPFTYWRCGFDLERLNPRTGGIEPINTRANKEALISNQWKAVVGTIDPPEKLEGLKVMCELYPAKRMQRGNIAKNVLLPLQVLPDDFVFTGEKTVVISRRDQDATSTDGQQPVAAVAQTVPLEDALGRLPSVLAGQNVNNLAGLVNAVPQELRSSELIDAVISGKALQQLQDGGAITVGADGTIADVSA